MSRILLMARNRNGPRPALSSRPRKKFRHMLSRDQRQILIDRLDPDASRVSGRAVPTGRPLNCITPTRRVEAVHHLDQRRLARSVVADQPDDLAALDLEGDPDGHDIAEIHGDVAKRENARRRARRRS